MDPQLEKKMISNILDRVLLKKYPGIEEIIVNIDTTHFVIHKITIVNNKYDNIYLSDEIKKDIYNIMRSLGIGLSKIDNIVFAMRS
jgi:NACalpha-BTF3-like transcription factor